MCRLIESINVINGELIHLDYHVRRMNKSRRDLFDCSIGIDMERIIHLASYCVDDQYKCRILYGKDIEVISFELYLQKSITSLKIVEYDDIIYNYKSEDRRIINSLFEQRGKADDIIIVKNGMLTDSSYCNIALYDGKQWYTPQNPLLKGCQRSFLLDNNLISERKIHLNDLSFFSKITLFNAMINPFEIIINVKDII